MQKIIAEACCIFKSAKGEMRPIKIYLRAPYKLGDEEWGSYCHAEGLFEKEIRIHGISYMQALCLALAFLKLQLRSFEEQGGSFYYPEDVSSPLLADELFGDILPTTGRHTQA